MLAIIMSRWIAKSVDIREPTGPWCVA
jgi:hypothetical protein